MNILTPMLINETMTPIAQTSIVYVLTGHSCGVTSWASGRGWNTFTT